MENVEFSPKAQLIDQSPAPIESPKTPTHHTFSMPMSSPMRPVQDPAQVSLRLAHFVERKRVRTESLCSNKSSVNLSSKDINKYRRPEEKSPFSRRDFKSRNELLKKDKSSLTMKDMIYFNPKGSPMSSKKSTAGAVDVKPVLPIEIPDSKPPTPIPSSLPEKMETAPTVPQIKLGANGEIMLDESTLVIESKVDVEAKAKIAQSAVIFDDGSSGKYGIYKRQKRTREWDPEETIRFYRCLQTIGTDFSMMQQLFPNRTRRDLKLKFKKEEKNNLGLINKALIAPKEFNIEELKAEFEKEEAARAEKRAAAKEKDEKAREQKKKDSANRQREKGIEIQQQIKSMPRRAPSKMSRALTEGDSAYELVNRGVYKRTKRQRTISLPVSGLKQEEYVLPGIMPLQRVKQEAVDEPQPRVHRLHSYSDVVVKPDGTRFIIDYKEEAFSGDDADADDKSLIMSEAEIIDESDLQAAQEAIDEAVDQEKLTTDVVDHVEEVTVEEPMEAEEGAAPSPSYSMDLEDIDLDSLVLTVTLDPQGQERYEVYQMSPDGRLDRTPLDLPREVIETLAKIYQHKK